MKKKEPPKPKARSQMTDQEKIAAWRLQRLARGPVGNKKKGEKAK